MPDITTLSDQDLQKALGYSDSHMDITKLSNDDLTKAIQPADESSEIKDAQWGANNPGLRALQNTASQSLINPIYQAGKAISPVVDGIAKGIGYKASDDPLINDKPNFTPPDMSNAPMAARVLGDVTAGATKGAAATAAGGGNPLLGYGALSSLEASGRGENPVSGAIKGTISAIPQMIAGKVGSTLASAAAKPFGGMISKFAPNVGTALGMGGASAVEAARTGGNPIEAAATGATFGVMSPMNPIGSKIQVTPEQHDTIIDNEGAPLYRNILNPGKGIIKKVEIKSGGDINDSMKLAAKDALPINSVEGKIDNRAAMDQIKSTTAPLYNEQNQILASNPGKQFDLQSIGGQVKANLSKNEKSASDLAADHAKVDNEINAEILRHGQNVDGQTLNMIKQGMWGKSYNPLEPNANDGARAIGFAMKDAIEKAYPDQSIMENNAKIGQYLQLQRILEATHGQVVQGGKIGKYSAQGAGMLAGGLVSAHAPFLGEIAGPLVGREIGGRVNDFMNDPTRLTSNWKNKISKYEINNPNPAQTRRPGVVSPQVVGAPGVTPSMNPVTNAITGKAPIGLPSPRNVPYNPSQHTVMGQGSIKMPNLKGEGVLESGRPDLPYTPGPEAIITPPPGTPEHAQTFSQGSVNPLVNVQQGSAIDPLGKKIAPLVVAGALGIGSVFNPSNSQASTVKDPERLKLSANQYIMKNEGWKAIPYLDTNGNKTVGYGFKEGGMAWKYVPDAVKQGRRAMTQEEGINAFNKAYPAAVSTAQKFAGDNWGLLSEGQQKALTDMAYQMGSIGFPKLRQAIESGNFNTASREILNSKYARKDAPQRALQNAILMQQ